MDTNQLKLILEALQGAGESARDIALAYIIASVVPAVLSFLGVMVFIFAAYRLGYMALCRHASSERTAEGWKRVCLMLGDSRAAILPTPMELESVVSRLDKILNKTSQP